VNNGWKTITPTPGPIRLRPLNNNSQKLKASRFLAGQKPEKRLALLIVKLVERLSREMELVMFRLVQECLATSIATAEARVPPIRIAREQTVFPSRVRLTVKGNIAGKTL